MRILSVVGARPQFVKAAPVSRSLRARHEEILVHTGQHYDEAMSASFFRDLEMPEPDLNLGVGGGSHAAMTGAMLTRLEPVVVDHQPHGVLVYGDTNSTLAGALVASKVEYADGRRPWIAHVEAGLRSFNRRMPEERNRIVADHLGDLLLAPTQTAMANLANEGLGARAELVGDVMVDAHAWAAERAATHLPQVAGEHPDYLLLTLHRAENVDDPARLRAWLAALPDDLPIIFPVHPRTLKVIEHGAVLLPSNAMPIAPVGFLEMVALEAHARLIATDSGGVQKEAYLSGVPCVTLRSETEWVETVETGWNRVAGDPVAAATILAEAVIMDRATPRPQLFGDGRAADRIVAALERHHERTHGVGSAPKGMPQEATAS